MEGPVLGLSFIKLHGPLAVEVDGVNQEHHSHGVDYANDLADLASGVLVHPLVDYVGCGGVIEVQGHDFRLIELTVTLKEVGIEVSTLSGSQRVGDGKLHFGVGSCEVASQGRHVIIDFSTILSCSNFNYIHLSKRL